MNDDGDRNHALAKPERTLRIAFFGDSFVQAREVNHEQGFVHLVERKLASCANPNINEVEAFNFGFSGYNTAQALMMMRKKALKYRPGIVALGFFVGNDVTDNVKKLNNFYHDNDDLNILYLFFNGDDELAFDMSFRDRPSFKRKLNSPFHKATIRLINRFATLQFLNFVRQRWRGFLPSPAPDAEESR